MFVAYEKLGFLLGLFPRHTAENRLFSWVQRGGAVWEGHWERTGSHHTQIGSPDKSPETVEFLHRSASSNVILVNTIEHRKCNFIRQIW